MKKKTEMKQEGKEEGEDDEEDEVFFTRGLCGLIFV